MIVIFYSIVGLGLGFVGYQLAQFSLQTSSPKSKLNNDLKILRGLLADQKTEDYSKVFEISDLKELSPNIVNTTRKLGINPIKAGSFSSIFQEPIVYFAFKHFNTKPGAYLFITQIGEFEFNFFKYDSEILVYEKEKSLGIINSNGEFIGNNGKLIAKLSRIDEFTNYSIYINDRKVVILVRPEEVSIAEISRIITFSDIEKDTDLESILVLISHYLRIVFLA